MTKISGIRDWEDRLRGRSKKQKERGGSDPLIQNLLDIGITMENLRSLSIEENQRIRPDFIFPFEFEKIKEYLNNILA